MCSSCRGLFPASEGDGHYRQHGLARGLDLGRPASADEVCKLRARLARNVDPQLLHDWVPSRTRVLNALVARALTRLFLFALSHSWGSPSRSPVRWPSRPLPTVCRSKGFPGAEPRQLCIRPFDDETVHTMKEGDFVGGALEGSCRGSLSVNDKRPLNSIQLQCRLGAVKIITAGVVKIIIAIFSVSYIYIAGF